MEAGLDSLIDPTYLVTHYLYPSGSSMYLWVASTYTYI